VKARVVNWNRSTVGASSKLPFGGLKSPWHMDLTLGDSPFDKSALARRKEVTLFDRTVRVASAEDLDTVRRAAALRPGTTVGDVVVAPWPQCEAMQTLDDALVAPDRPAVDIGGRGVLRDGDPLRITVRTPRRARYLYVSYVQTDGSLVHLVQPRGAVPAKRTVCVARCTSRRK